MEAIILAGGLGTRLREEVGDLPKSLAPVNGKPFLEYVLEYLETQFVDKVVLSLGYGHEQIIEWLKSKAFTFKLTWVIEREPLGTGGGIRRALQKCSEPHVFVLNGDTLFKADLRAMEKLADGQTEAVIALKAMRNFDRYGAVTLDDHHRITAFTEKQPMGEGLINGGVYLLNVAAAGLSAFPEKFSFEKDYLEKTSGTLRGLVSEGLFIDIGVPEDYKLARQIL